MMSRRLLVGEGLSKPEINMQAKCILDPKISNPDFKFICKSSSVYFLYILNNGNIGDVIFSLPIVSDNLSPTSVKIFEI